MRLSMGWKPIVATCAAATLFTGGLAVLVSSIDQDTLVAGFGIVLAAALFSAGACMGLLALHNVVVVTSNRNRRALEKRYQDGSLLSERVLDVVKQYSNQLALIETGLRKLRKEVALDALLYRLQAFERRVVASLETSSLDRHDSLEVLDARLASIQSTVSQGVKGVRDDVDARTEDLRGSAERQFDALEFRVGQLDENLAKEAASLRQVVAGQRDALSREMQTITEQVDHSADHARRSFDSRLEKLDEGFTRLQSALSTSMSDLHGGLSALTGAEDQPISISGVQAGLEALTSEIREISSSAIGPNDGDQLKVTSSEVNAWMSDYLIERLASSSSKSINSLRAHVNSTATDTVRQVEALLQLVPRVDTELRRFPASSGWAMSPEGLLLVSDLVRRRAPQLIVELGSGASTIWTGTFVQRMGGRLVAIEHNADYLEKTREMVADYGLEDTVDLRLAELTRTDTPHGGALWYDLEEFQDLEEIDLLIVDGPPKATGPEARYPALPLLESRLASDCIVVVDDFQRADEREIVEHWLQESSGFRIIESGVERVGLIARS